MLFLRKKLLKVFYGSIVHTPRSWGQFLDLLEKLLQVVPAPPAPVEERPGPPNLLPEPLPSWPHPERSQPDVCILV